MSDRASVKHEMADGVTADRTNVKREMASGANDSVTQVETRECAEDLERTRTNSLNSTYSANESMSPETNGKQSAPVQPSPPPPLDAPFRARLFDGDPVTKGKRKLYFVTIAGGTFAMIIVIFAVLSIFWGSLFRVNNYIHKLEGWVIVCFSYLF